VGITLEQHEESSVIRLEGAIDIASASELKKQLLQALGASREVCVALEKATDLDVTTVQLLWAAGREAKVSGVGFALMGHVPEPVTSALTHAGLEITAHQETEARQGGVDSCQP
jgi:anti-anti-sigma factor